MPLIQIAHIDLTQRDEIFHADERECLFLFWWEDVPVGQTRSTGEPGRLIPLAPLIRKSVVPEALAEAKRQKAALIASARQADPRVTVVICTRDRPEALARCLASLPEQTHTPDEVIVVDNASRETTTKEVTLAARVTYVLETRPGLDVARNTGARAAKGDLIVYTDDDVRLHPRWLERMVRAFDDPRIMAVTGAVLPAELETEAQIFFEDLWPLGRGFRPKLFGETFFREDKTTGCRAWEVGAGANMAFRGKAFAEVGYFDERLDVGQAGCSGDSEYWHRLLSRGWLCRYEPSAVVFHYHRRDMAGLSRQVYSYMRGHAAALLVQYERSRNLGNLWRLLVTLPSWFITRLIQREWWGGRTEDRFIQEELRGYLSGIRFYNRTPRSQAYSEPGKLHA